MELTEFVRARLDEDEAAAKAATPGPWRPTDSSPDMTHSVRHDPARVLREVAAGRMIVTMYLNETAPMVHEPEPEVKELIEQRAMVLEDVLREFAVVWQDHPDYRDDW